MSAESVQPIAQIVHIPEAGEGIECRAVSGWSDYAVGSDGSVWTRIPYPSNKRIPAGESPPWRRLLPSVGKNGYALVSLHAHKKLTRLYVHRIVLMSFIGPPPTPLHCAAHADGNRTHNAAANLRWSTRSENENDKKSHGTYHSRGQVLTDDDARRAVTLYKTTPMSQQQIANKFGVTVATISNLLAGRTYGYLGLDLSGMPQKKVAFGERGGISPLTADKVRDIRQKRASGRTLMSISAEFGVSFASIQRICVRKTWRHV